MGKHEAPRAPKRKAGASGGEKKKHIGLWIALALLMVLVVWGVWFFTTPPPQDGVGDDPDAQTATGPSDALTGTQPGGEEATNPAAGEEPPARQMKKGWYTILLAGTMDGYNTDTMMLCSVDSENGKVKLVSINRDTQVDAPIDIPKINAMYGWAEGGVRTMCAKVTELTGVPINQYVVIDMDAFKEVIDLIGGVDYNVPFDMYHKDLNLDYHIDLKAGQQTLDGSEALQFVRYRSTSENDFGRVNRQKDFLIATMKQVLKKFSISQIENYIGIFNENVETNMSVQDMVWYFTNVAAKLDFDEDVTSDTLPYAETGYWTNPNAKRYKTQSYVYLDPQQIVDYVNEHLNPYDADITADELNIPRWIND